MPLDKLEAIGLFSLDRTPVLDRVVEMAQSLLDCKVSLVSLIDEPNNRQFFKAEAGLQLPWSEQRQTPLSHSFCKTVVAYGATLLITDARLDARFKDNGAVGALGFVAYLGVPLKDETGAAFGALCVLDTEGRVWTSDDVNILQALGEGVSVQIKLMLASHKAELSKLREDKEDIDKFVSFDNRPGVVFSCFQSGDGREALDLVSGVCEEIWEIDCENFKDRFSGFFAMCVPDDLINARVSLGNSAARLSHWQHEWRIVTPSGAVKRLRGYGYPEVLSGGGIKWNAVVRDVTAEVQSCVAHPN